MNMKAGWRFVWITSGEQWVTIVGTSMMLQLYADNLDTPLLVSFMHCSPCYWIVHSQSLRIWMFTGATAYMNAYFGQGNGPIFMDLVSCGSSDTALLACSYDPNTSEDYHGEDAGVRCGGECNNSYAFLPDMLCSWPSMHMTHFVHNTFCWKQLPAQMVKFVWLMVEHNMKGEWKCVLMEDGALCVIDTGELKKPKWCADSWDFHW